MKQYRLRKEINHPLGSVKEGVKSIFKGGYYVFPYTGKEFDHNGNGWLGNGFMIQDPSFFSDWFEEVNTVEKESDIVLEMRGSHDGIEHRDSRTHFKKKNRFDGKRLSKLEIKANLSCQEDCKDLIDILEIHKFCFLNPEPSSKKEEGWEILSVIGKSTGFIYKKRQGEFFYKEGYLDIKLSQVLDGNVVSGCEIHSVLRKSDNTVFTVGDEVVRNNYADKIYSFEINGDSMNVGFCGGYEIGFFNLSEVSKAPTNTVENNKYDYETTIGMNVTSEPKKFYVNGVQYFPPSKTNNQ